MTLGPVRSVLLLALGGLLACSSVPSRDSTPPAERAAEPRMPERAAAYARPEPDPMCRATVQDTLYSNGLDKVIVKLARKPDGHADIVEFLSPDLTPAAKAELNRAYGMCVWSAVTPPAAVAPGVEVWVDTTELRNSPQPSR